MRAMRVHRPGEGLHLDQIEVPVAGPGEIIVWVAACGVCRTDLHIADGDLPLRKTPVVPGHEVVGEFVELGAGVNRFTIGQAVGVSWLQTDGGQ